MGRLFDQIVQYCEDNELHPTAFPEQGRITFLAGHRVKAVTTVHVVEENGWVIFRSSWLTLCPMEKRREMAEFICRVNMEDCYFGNFELDMDDGRIIHRETLEAIPGERLSEDNMHFLLWARTDIMTNDYLPLFMKMLYADMSQEEILQTRERFISPPEIASSGKGKSRPPYRYGFHRKRRLNGVRFRKPRRQPFRFPALVSELPF